MNKVKPQVGQVWKFIATGNARRVAKVDRKMVEFGNNERKSISSFLWDMEFAPQNDLEWLAVNVDKWVKNNFVYRASGYDCGYGFLDNHASITYTRQQWQNMRYKLGLDVKPRISAKQWAEMLRVNHD